MENRTTGRFGWRLAEFVDILLSDEVIGTARLRQLAGDRDAYLILHVSDIYKIGAMAPERLSVGYQDFGKVGDLHAMASGSKIGFMMKSIKPTRYCQLVIG